jgi:signal transduction histidine kinase
MIEKDLDATIYAGSGKYSLTYDDKVLIAKKAIHQIDGPSFLCKENPKNSNFFEIIECNEKFLKKFHLDIIEVIGNSYDFLFQVQGVDYSSSNYFDCINLSSVVRNKRAGFAEVSIAHPKEENKMERFMVNISPSSLNTDDIFFTFSFDSLGVLEEEVFNKENLTYIVQNFERSIKNEKMLRDFSNIIASESNLKESMTSIVKIVCEYLKVDRCILYNSNPGSSGFVIEYCSGDTKSITKDWFSEQDSPLKAYLAFHKKLFDYYNDLKVASAITVDEDIWNNKKFESVKESCRELCIGSQIVNMMVANNSPNGYFYLHQASRRYWLPEEVDFISALSNQVSVAIERSGYVGQLLVSNLDLEKSLKKEKEMRDLQSEFVTLVSHEFKTPLQIIDIGREMITRTMKSQNIANDIVSGSLLKIKNAIVRMNDLIQNNLKLSQMDDGDNGMQINKESFNIKSLIEEILEKNSSLSKERAIAVEIDISNLPISYNGDIKLLDHSLTNIIGNAIKYSKANSKIKILGEIKDGSALLKVSDSGIGIPKDDLEKIGRKFFRASNTTLVSGTGVGMYMTKHFIELHGGSVSIESELNVGTTVTISLPISK